ARPGEETGGGEAAAAIAAPGPIDQVATDNKFSFTKGTILVNQQYTLNLSNKGAATHNWHLLNVTGTDGKEITTPLLAGGGSESVNFTIGQAGTYNFQCDVHPTEMRGALTVTDQSAAPAAGASAGGGSPGPGTIVEITTDNKFSLAALNAAANQSTT